ncbi:MAG: uncharacterized protein K0Q72_4508 [Armatimonadetes bacterium]|jgi:hypothetical protein|nr:uncharacterized protein [Armatimonadota bacterium]
MVHPQLSVRFKRSAFAWLAAAAFLLPGAQPGHAAGQDAQPGDPLGQRVVLIQGTKVEVEPDPAHHHPTDAERKARLKQLATLSLEQLMELEIVPINVLGGHTHPTGQWMVGYRYMYANMAGNLNGTQSVSNGRLLRRYLDVPTSMEMEMHMLEAMYAPSERLTLMLMAPYSRMWMERESLLPGGHNHGGGGSGGPLGIQAPGGAKAQSRFQTRSAGWGDLTFMSLYTLRGDAGAPHRVLLNSGFSAPTGSINQTHRGGGRHDYMMQLGSGTFDLMPGLTYLGETRDWSWGGQVMGTVRLGTNENGYRLGNRLRLNAWGSYRLTDWVAPSLRLEGQRWGRIQGSDFTLDPLVDPTFDPNNYGGERIDLLLGVNLYAPRGKWKGMRLSIEGGVPIYQSLNGPQLETDWMLGFSLSYTR